MRKLLNKNEQFNNSEIHENIIPIDIRSNEAVNCRLIYKTLSYNLKVWKLSPIGIELQFTNDLDIQVGQLVDLNIYINNQNTRFNGIYLKKIYLESGKQIACFRLIQTEHKSNLSSENRTAQRWNCNDEFLPTGVTLNPMMYNDLIYFKLKDISKNGIQLTTSLRNKFILVGMKFKSTFYFPTIGETSIEFKIENLKIINENNKSFLRIGATYEKNSNIQFTDYVSQYLLQFSNIESLDELRSNDFNVLTLKNAVTFRFVKTQEDYEKVLELRKIAYSREGKVSADSSIYDMVTEFDSNSRIVMGLYNNQVVISNTVIFHNQVTKSEQELFVKWDERFPPKEKTVEINRLCTHPDFRKSDLLLQLFKFNCVFICQAGREFVILSSTDELKKIYESLGFYNTNIHYFYKELGNKKHTIYKGKIIDGITGKNVNPIYWNIVWADVVKYLKNYEVIETNFVMNFRMWIYSFFKKPAQIIFRNKLLKKKK